MEQRHFGVLGAGFWSQFQLAAWREVGGAKPVAVYNRTRAKALALAERFEIPAVYDDPEQLLKNEKLDFVDIITAVETHAPLVKLAAKYKTPIICQKPMATNYNEAKSLVNTCREAGVPFAIHENWRWQHPIRELKKTLDKGKAGNPFRAHIHYCSSFPVFENQPFLKEVEQFILADMGSHLFDAARFLFGEAKSLYCITDQVHKDIRGEDVATVMMNMERATVTCQISYASRTEHERFPEVFILIECDNGSVELAPDYWIRVTAEEGTSARRCPPPRYDWADPAYDLVHASIVSANADLLRAIKTGEPAETSGEDNLKTMQLVFSAYESAQKDRVIHL